jgi:hypothetical protein
MIRIYYLYHTILEDPHKSSFQILVNLIVQRKKVLVNLTDQPWNKPYNLLGAGWQILKPP